MVSYYWQDGSNIIRFLHADRSAVGHSFLSSDACILSFHIIEKILLSNDPVFKYKYLKEMTDFF